MLDGVSLFEWTIIGPAVNETARSETLARPECNTEAQRPQRSQRSHRPQPNKRDDAHSVRSGGRRLRHRTSGASPRSQSSKQVFQRGEAGRRGAEDAERKDFGASRRVRSNTRRSAILSFSVASAPPFLLLCVEKLACLGSAARTHYRRVSTGQHKDARIPQGTALGAILAEAPGESVCYRHPGGNSSRVAVIRRISSAEKAQKGRLWRFAQNAQRAPLLVVRPRPALAAISRRSADATNACNDLGTSRTDY